MARGILEGEEGWKGEKPGYVKEGRASSNQLRREILGFDWEEADLRGKLYLQISPAAKRAAEEETGGERKTRVHIQ